MLCQSHIIPNYNPYQRKMIQHINTMIQTLPTRHGICGTTSYQAELSPTFHPANDPIKLFAYQQRYREFSGRIRSSTISLNHPNPTPLLRRINNRNPIIHNQRIILQRCTCFTNVQYSMNPSRFWSTDCSIRRLAKWCEQISSS